MDQYYSRQNRSDDCSRNPNGTQNQEAVSGAKATAVNKNWNIVYANVINGSEDVRSEVARTANATEAQRAGDFISRLRDTLDDRSGNEAETEDSEVNGKARVRNININGIVNVNVQD